VEAVEAAALLVATAALVAVVLATIILGAFPEPEPLGKGMLAA
jgi:hypothetical protein